MRTQESGSSFLCLYFTLAAWHIAPNHQASSSRFPGQVNTWEPRAPPSGKDYNYSHVLVRVFVALEAPRVQGGWRATGTDSTIPSAAEVIVWMYGCIITLQVVCKQFCLVCAQLDNPDEQAAQIRRELDGRLQMADQIARVRLTIYHMYLFKALEKNGRGHIQFLQQLAGFPQRHF